MQAIRLFFLLMTFLVLICQPCLWAAEETNPWRAGAEVLTQRVERLAAGGEVDAAAAVMARLLEREGIADTGLDDRARLALARGYLAAGRIAQALRTVNAISWADKAPEVAAEVVSLTLAIRWQGLHDDQGRLRSGMIPPRDSFDAEEGRAAGPWLQRREHWRALNELLGGGVRMVAAEGGELTWPRPAPWLALARYAYNRLNADELPALAGADAEWLGALVALHVEEHEIPAAWAVAQVLLRRFPQHQASQASLLQLGLWRERRERARRILPLWPMPDLEQAIAAAIVARPAIEAQVQKAIEQEWELLMAAQMWPLQAEVAQQEAYDIILEGDGYAEVAYEEWVWELARSYDGIQVQPQVRNLPVGESQELRLSSTLRGPHEIALYALDSLAAYEALAKDPVGQAQRLQAEPLRRMVVEFFGDPGQATVKNVPLPGSAELEEGFYALRVSARGSPVVAISGFSVVDPDLYVLSAREALQVWVVSRASGAPRAHEPLAVELTLLRQPERAAGAAWANASAPWRAGFRAAFLDEDIEALIRDEDQAELAAGRAAGLLAKEQDPPRKSTHFLASNAQGLAQLALPEAFHGRPYQATVRIDRGDVAVARAVSHGVEREWALRSIAWADRPLLRPGESLHWRALLRDFDGSRLRRPSGHIKAAIRITGLEERILWQDEVPISDDGSLHGQLHLPSSLRRLGESVLELRLSTEEQAGEWQHLAKMRELSLPEVSLDISQASEALRSGEDQVLSFTLRDASGAGIADTPIQVSVNIYPEDGPGVPGQTLESHSDLGGVAQLRVPSLAGRNALYRARIAFEHGGQRYLRHIHWRSSVFPFPLQVELREAGLRAGQSLHLRGTFPAAARLQWWLEADGRRLGEVQEWQGDDRGWSETRLTLGDVHVGATTLVLSHPVLDGPPARRELEISVQSAPSAREFQAGELRLEPSATRVDPGQVWSARLGGLSPRAAGLLIIGDDMLRHAAVAQGDASERGLAIFTATIEATWGPSTHMQAISYLPGRGFVESPRQELEIRPIDTLLRVTVQPEHARYRPGDVVRAGLRVSDWQGQPAAGARLSVGVVDQRLYHLAEDETPDLWEYFHHYKRPWQLSQGLPISHRVPEALLWRAVIGRWQLSEAGTFGSRAGGGVRRSVGAYGGSRASEPAYLLLEASPSPLVLWLADVETDAQGEASIHFPLPQEPGTWRITVRANDAAHRLRVGEVRQDLSAQLQVQAHLRGPTVMTPGDVLPLEVELHNRREVSTQLRLTAPDGQVHELRLPARGRRLLQLSIQAPAIDPDLPLTWDAGHLGQLRQHDLRLESGPVWAEVQELRFQHLLRLPGLVEEYRLFQILPESGSLPLASGATAAQFELQAFADGGARARHWLKDPAGAMGLGESALQALGPGVLRRQIRASAAELLGSLLTERGRERLRIVSAQWPVLEQLNDPAYALLLAQIAHQRGMPMPAPRQQPSGLMGAWLLARAARVGMDMPRPDRGLQAHSSDERALLAATARLAGWREADSLWPSQLSGLSSQSLAILADAARLTDHPQAELLAQALATQPWHGPSADPDGNGLTAALAVLTLHQRPPQQPQALVLVDGLGGEHRLPLGAEQSWTGRLGPDAQLQGAPGTIVMASVRALQAAVEPDPAWLQFTWYQPGTTRQQPGVYQERWYAVSRDALRPGRHTLLRVGLSEAGRQALADSADGILDITALLPMALGSPDERFFELAVVEGLEPRWSYTGAPPDDHLLVQSAAQPLLRVLEEDAYEQPTAGSPLMISLSSHADNEHEVPQEAWLLLRSPDHEADLHWPGMQLSLVQQRDDADGAFLLFGESRSVTYQPAPLRLRGGSAPTQSLAEEALVFPYTNELRHLLPRLSSAERQALESHRPQSQAGWQRLLRTYDPEQQQTLEELLDHGLIGRAHWSTQRLASQAAQSWAQLLADPVRLRTLARHDEDSPWTVNSLLHLRSELEWLAHRAFDALAPAQRSALPIPTLRQLVSVLLPDAEASAWLWQQSLEARDLADLLPELQGEGWLHVLREIFGLQVTLDPQLPPGILPPAIGDEQAYSGPGLGSQWLEGQGSLRILPAEPEQPAQLPRYRLSSLVPPPPGPWGLQVHPHRSLAEIMQHLALIHRNRGLPAPRFSQRLRNDSRLKRSLRDIPEGQHSIPQILSLIAEQLGEPLRDLGNGQWVIGED